MTIRDRVLEALEKNDGLSKREIFRALDVNDNLQKEMKGLLKDMVKDGTLYRDEDKNYHASLRSGLMTGTFEGSLFGEWHRPLR